MEKQLEIPAEKPIIHILYAEDNVGDRYFFELYFQGAATKFQIHYVEDGQEALEYLRREGKYDAAPRPNLVLLDLNLPKRDGRDVLEEIKKEPNLKDIPVIIFTSSRSQEDRERCEALGVEKFKTKPADLIAFNAVLQGIEAWLLSKY